LSRRLENFLCQWRSCDVLKELKHNEISKIFEKPWVLQVEDVSIKCNTCFVSGRGLIGLDLFEEEHYRQDEQGVGSWSVRK
jgi:hypothetical protein